MATNDLQASNLTPTPASVLDTMDHGDDSGRRFRYQYTYAAIVCCILLDEAEDVEEVFCEHHEDVLVKLTSGQFQGLQIKTREIDQPQWKTNDEAVLSSFARFVELDTNFLGYFSAFKFLTNHPLHVAKTGKSLPYVLNSIKAAEVLIEVEGPAISFIAKVARLASRTEEQTFNALKKTCALDALPKLADIDTRLVQSLAPVWQRAEDCNYSSLHRAALNLVTECERASTLAHENLLPAYLPVSKAPVDSELNARIVGKRFNIDRVLSVLESGLHATELLDGDIDDRPMLGAGDRDKLLQKLDAGGFSVVSQNSAIDLRNKADVLGLRWTNKFGSDRGLRRYDHVRSLVLSDAARAFEATKTEDVKFGLNMLRELRLRFEERRSKQDQLYDASDEHLEGFAYSLTSQCEVQWSTDRPWEVL